MSRTVTVSASGLYLCSKGSEESLRAEGAKQLRETVARRARARGLVAPETGWREAVARGAGFICLLVEADCSPRNAA